MGRLIDVPSDLSGWGLADWAEQIALIEGGDPPTRTSLKERLTGSGPPEDSALDEALTEIERRSRLAPTTYPLRVDDERRIVVAGGIRPQIYTGLTWLALDGSAAERQQAADALEPSFSALWELALPLAQAGVDQAIRLAGALGESLNLEAALRRLAGSSGVAFAANPPDPRRVTGQVVGWGTGHPPRFVLLECRLGGDTQTPPLAPRDLADALALTTAPRRLHAEALALERPEDSPGTLDRITLVRYLELIDVPEAITDAIARGIEVLQDADAPEESADIVRRAKPAGGFTHPALGRGPGTTTP